MAATRIVSQSGGRVEGQPKALSQKEKLVIAGIVHPFFATHDLKEQGIIYPWDVIAKFYENPDNRDLLDVKEEFKSADRILDRARKHATNPSARLVFVSHLASEHDYEVMKAHYRDSVFEDHPRDVLNNEAMMRKVKDLNSLGLNPLIYDELWMLAQTLRIFTPDRTLFFHDEINQDQLYAELGPPDQYSGIRGVFMGTYTSDCVASRRNRFCDTLNVPYTDVAVVKSASVDQTWPRSHEREDKVGEITETVSALEVGDERVRRFVGRALWGLWARESVRKHRHSSTYEGVLKFTPEHRGWIRTLLRDDRFLEKTFGRYRMSELQKGPEMSFLLDPKAVGRIVEFLAGETLMSDHCFRDEKPWLASKTEVMDFKVKLASFLAGRELVYADIPGFLIKYREEMTRIPWQRILTDRRGRHE
jgi:hypothetical protein